MNNVRKFPTQLTYDDRNDPTNLKRTHDRMFGVGSWEDSEKSFFERCPEFAPGGMYSRDKREGFKPKIKTWWQFWKPKNNIITIKE